MELFTLQILYGGIITEKTKIKVPRMDLVEQQERTLDTSHVFTPAKSDTYKTILKHRERCPKWSNNFCLDCFGGGLTKFTYNIELEKKIMNNMLTPEKLQEMRERARNLGNAKELRRIERIKRMQEFN